LGGSVTLLKDILYITYIQNPGAAFGFMANLKPVTKIPLFVLITLLAGLIVFSYQRLIAPEKKWQRFALGLIGGGALGNFIDRIFYGQVVDFIDVEHIVVKGYRFPWVFNVADSCITIGITILVCIYLFGPSAERRT
jgi:signal peptidase II